MIRKLLSVLFFATVTGMLLAAGGTGEKTDGSTIKIGISKIVAHPALDAVEKGVQDELASRGITAVYDLQNANGDVNTATQIATKFKRDNVDVIVAIATPMAVSAANSVRDIPVVFSVVTDPVSAGLVRNLSKGEGNVTGLSDKTDIYAHLELFKRIAGIKTLGHIYTSSEANSAASLAELEDACKKLSIKLVVQSINNSSEVKQATEAIIRRVDGIYLTTDNTVYSALPALVEVALSQKKPVFSSDPTSAIEGGCVIASGFDYYKAGRATGAMVAEILEGRNPDSMPTKFLTDPSEQNLLLDLDAAKICGITLPEDLVKSANQIIENGKLTTR